MKINEPSQPNNLPLNSPPAQVQIQQLKGHSLVTQPLFGFIVMNEQGALYATLQGNDLQIIYRFTIYLPKRYSKGGASSIRFARLRKQKINKYLRKVCEVAVQAFIQDNKCLVTGLVLATNDGLRNHLNNLDLFDPRLQSKTTNVDTSYAFEIGLNQAIEKSAEALQKLECMEEQELICGFFEHIALGDNLIVYGVHETMKYIESGAVAKIVCYQNFDYLRIRLKNPQTGIQSTIYAKPENAHQPELYKDGNIELEKVEEETSLAQWIANHHKDFDCQLEFVTDKSSIGKQFVKGFGGFGGFLRHKIDFESEETEFIQDHDSDFI